MQKLTSKMRWGIWVVGFACLLLITPIQVTPLSLFTDGLKPTFSAQMLGATPIPVDKELDLNQDGKQECVSLDRGVLTVFPCGATQADALWQSPAGWTVKQWTFSDLNGDALPEITMLVWRRLMIWAVLDGWWS
ncbi:hypothetical protein EG832_15380, partial [bacterium]|nr:hypothetical protein [bacterium]